MLAPVACVGSDLIGRSWDIIFTQGSCVGRQARGIRGRSRILLTEVL